MMCLSSSETISAGVMVRHRMSPFGHVVGLLDRLDDVRL